MLLNKTIVFAELQLLQNISICMYVDIRRSTVNDNRIFYSQGNNIGRENKETQIFLEPN